MSRFYTNKHPINHGGEEPLPVGTVFTIASISGSWFELEPISKVKDLLCPVQVDCQMLDRGFTEQEHCK